MGCLRKSRRSAWLKQSERANIADEVKREAGTRARQGPAKGFSFRFDFRKLSSKAGLCFQTMVLRFERLSPEVNTDTQTS